MIRSMRQGVSSLLHWILVLWRVLVTEPAMLVLFLLFPPFLWWSTTVGAELAEARLERAEIQATVKQVSIDQRVRDEVMEERLLRRVEALERSVYVDVYSVIDQKIEEGQPPAARRGPELWQRNTITDLRQRVAALERWRLEMNRR